MAPEPTAGMPAAGDREARASDPQTGDPRIGLIEQATNRIDELESRSAFQEDLLAQLSDALVDQQNRIDQLETVLRNLSGAVASASASPEDSDPLSEVPPHY